MRALVTVAALFVVSCDARSAPSPALAIRVIDGDTFELNGEKIRISNIDAPELPPGAKCWSEGALAIQAARTLQGLLTTNARTMIVQREGKDQYGRTLARVVIRGTQDVGEGLVGLGLVAEWKGRRWDWCSGTQFAEVGGPSFMGGPGGNKPFVNWLVVHELSGEQIRDREE